MAKLSFNIHADTQTDLLLCREICLEGGTGTGGIINKPLCEEILPVLLPETWVLCGTTSKRCTKSAISEAFARRAVLQNRACIFQKLSPTLADLDSAALTAALKDETLQRRSHFFALFVGTKKKNGRGRQ